MNPDTVTAGGWALWALALTTWLAFTAWLITSARRELRGAQALAAALHARDQDTDQLMTVAGLPPDEFDREWREWQARQ